MQGQPFLFCPSTATGTPEKKTLESTRQGWGAKNFVFASFQKLPRFFGFSVEISLLTVRGTQGSRFRVHKSVSSWAIFVGPLTVPLWTPNRQFSSERRARGVVKTLPRNNSHRHSIEGSFGHPRTAMTHTPSRYAHANPHKCTQGSVRWELATPSGASAGPGKGTDGRTRRLRTLVPVVNSVKA